jgi:minor extracellular serine protease Vpr
VLATRARVGLSATLIALVAAGSLAGSEQATAVETTAEDESSLYLVTLNGPGTSLTADVLPADVLSIWMRATQDQILASVDAPGPTYRWTTALNGVAVELSADQARRLATDSRVALVEPNRTLALADVDATATFANYPTSGVTSPAPASGAGTVIGFVDSGLTPEGSVFADTPGLGPMPRRYGGDCRIAPDWLPEDCGAKVVGAQWYVEGFGVDRIRGLSSLSARDDDGHGTAVASVAAGNSGLTATVDRRRLGRFSSVAPGARIAAYKACWTAPDPDDDGCATADVVTAIDRATADRVDVLNVSVAGDRRRDPAQDTVARAMLGAAEGDIAVIAAAGNGPGEIAFALPWVTTVGATTGPIRGGEVVRPGAAPLPGVTVAARPTGPARLVRGVDVALSSARRAAARRCEPGSLDASRARGAIVLCARGAVARTAKSLAVQRADGVGMVLSNRGPGSLDPDLHAVPTVHVSRAAGRDLSRWLARNPHRRVTLRPTGVRTPAARETIWSRRSGGAPGVLAVGSGVLAAGRSGTSDTRWSLVSGTSIATAHVSGAAAALRSETTWSAVEVRNALAVTAQGARATRGGIVDTAAARASALVVGASSGYRSLLGDPVPGFGVAALRAGRSEPTTLTIRNPTGRVRTYRASVNGVPMSVEPAVVTLRPGQSTEVVLSPTGRARTTIAGTLTWRTPGKDAVVWRIALTR